MAAKNIISEEQKATAEEQIRTIRKEIDYNTRDYSIDFLIQQFRENEFYIPDEYQRQYIWNNADKNRFIESILLGLPIPLMFFSDTEDGRCEIIDGAQRTQAMEEFMSGDLILSDLKKLTSLNGFSYNDIPAYFRKKFDKTNMRIIVLSDDTTLDIRQEIFNRINTTGREANPSEIRRGSFRGPFMDFLMECTKDDVFKDVCPISETMEKRYEQLELVIRFFAFLNHYQEFTHRVDSFLDDYIENTKSSFDKAAMKTEFDKMLQFVKTYFPYGFAKSERAKSTPRVRFEAISVGVALALREKPDLVPVSMDWLNSDDFKRHTTTHASNSPARVSGRILYVKEQLLRGGCMMQAIFDMFDERVQEIDLYFEALKELDQGNTEHLGISHYFDSEFIKILKANTLLMVYNLVESTVMGGILEIYDKLKQEGLTYSGVRKEIKDIWFAYKFRQVYDQQAHYNSYRDKAIEIVNSILTGEIIELDRKATAISGNLDAQQIRNVCHDHGICFTPEAGCRGGVVLETVKDRRNDLAHGTLSFAECGRDYSIEDLVKIKEETVLFLRGLLNGMKQYYDGKQYKL